MRRGKEGSKCTRIIAIASSIHATFSIQRSFESNFGYELCCMPRVFSGDSGANVSVTHVGDVQVFRGGIETTIAGAPKTRLRAGAIVGWQNVA